MSRVILYSKPDCPLCDEAKEMLQEAGVDFVESHDSAYDLRVPVVEVDGSIVTEGRVSARTVQRALRRQPPERSL